MCIAPAKGIAMGDLKYRITPKQLLLTVYWPNSTTRTCCPTSCTTCCTTSPCLALPDTDLLCNLLYNVLQLNSTTRTSCTTCSLVARPHPNILTCQDVGMWQNFVRCWPATNELVVQQVVELL